MGGTSLFGPVVLATALWYPGDAAPYAVQQAASFFLVLSLVLGAIWIYALWALQARPSAPLRQEAGV
ncbi:unnamed protein product [Effrenium voratum]|uniref:Uncharacterized protein n=1 Tax=Effrenium voratum TaxID=2562239 RepID=A0AA36MVY6_9DINO|nr:unnamed protein product [Effrenium voratum]